MEAENKLIAMLKEAYFEYKDAQKSQCHEDAFCRDLCLLEDVGRTLFGWTDVTIESMEDIFRAEWKKNNE